MFVYGGRSRLYQADDVLSLLAFGAESGPRAGAPAGRLVNENDPHPTGLIHRCGQPTPKGRCQNRVPVAAEAHADLACVLHPVPSDGRT